MEGDIFTLLDSIKVIIPIQEQDWEKVAAHFKETYCDQFFRPVHSSLALKTKFRKLMWRQQSGGSEKSKVEIKAKEIEKMIANKAGCIQEKNLPIFSNLVPESLSYSSSTLPANTPIHTIQGTRLGLKKNILNHMKIAEKECKTP